MRAGTPLSPGLREMIARADAEVPFGKAAALLADLAGIAVSARTIERSAEASGAAAGAAGAAEAAAIRARTIRPLPPPEPVPDMLYVAIDGTGVPVRASETEGRQGKSEDGKAGTREVKLARLFTQSGLDAKGRPVMDPGSSSYVATFDGKDTLADLVEAEYLRRGGEHFRQVVAPGDGAAWICYPDVGIADLIPVTRLSRRSPAWPLARPVSVMRAGIIRGGRGSR